MKKTINRINLVLKQRRNWKINPATKVIESKKRYNRNEMKQLTKEEIEQQLDKMENE